MNSFDYSRATDITDAIRQIAADPQAKFIAGGTNLIDLMKYDVERPQRLIDISGLALKSIDKTADGGLRIGALVPMVTAWVTAFERGCQNTSVPLPEGSPLSWKLPSLPGRA